METANTCPWPKLVWKLVIDNIGDIEYDRQHDDDDQKHELTNAATAGIIQLDSYKSGVDFSKMLCMLHNAAN